MQDDDFPTYSMISLARVLRRHINTLKNYTRSGREIVKREGNSLFTFRRSVQLALTLDLVDLGYRPEFAARVAFYFTDTGESTLPGRPARMPLEVFETGSTILCMYPNENIDIKPSKPSDAVELLFIDFKNVKHTTVTLVDITRYVKTFRMALERDANV